MEHKFNYTVIIVGGGPIGIACALEARKAGLDYLVLEKGCLVNSLYNYPANMTFFSTSERIEIGGVPFVSNNVKPNRSEALEYYRRVAVSHRVNIRLQESVQQINRLADSVEVISDHHTYTAADVIIATGFYDIPVLLDVPGENPLHAAQRELYEEAHLKAEDWRVLNDVYTTPGGCDEAVRIFLARDLSEADGQRFQVEDEESDMELARVPVADLVRGVLAGDLHNNCLVVGVLTLVAARTGDGLDALRPAEAPWPARPFEA